MTTRILARCLAWLGPLMLLNVEAAAAEPEAPAAGREAVAISTSLVTPFFGAYYAEADVRASSALSVLFNVSYLTLENDAWKTRTGTVGTGVRYHWKGMGLRRWYVEVSSELMLSSWRHEPSGRVSSIVPGFTVTTMVGYRFVWESGPTIDLGVGAVGLHFPSARVTTEAGALSSPAFTRLYPAPKVNVGWAF